MNQVKFLTFYFFILGVIFTGSVHAQSICQGGDYGATGSLTTDRFWSEHGNRVGLDIYEKLDDGRRVLEACFHNTNVNCRHIGTYLEEDAQVTWDATRQRAYFAYQQEGNHIQVGWVSPNGSGRNAVTIPGRTDEKPLIAYSPVMDRLLVTYEGNSSDKIYYNYADNVSRSNNWHWRANRVLGNGARTRFGPERLCLNPNRIDFVLQFRGRKNTRTCYQTRYYSTQDDWGNQTSCGRM